MYLPYSVYVYVAAAVGPAVLLMWFVYRHDKKDREPAYLLRKLLLGGLFAAVIAIILETVGENLMYLLLGNLSLSTSQAGLLNAVMVGFAEEFAKFRYLKKYTWNDPNFNFRYDALLYAVFVSLGFAAVENILYVFMYGITIAVPRALLAIPAHLAFSVFMGVFYGRAKICGTHGDDTGRRINSAAAYLFPVALHSVYDGILMSNGSMILFYVFVIAVDIAVFVRIRYESSHDVSIY